MQKRYWLGKGIISLVLAIFTEVIPWFTCSDFYRIGPSYPTDQPICHLLVVNGVSEEIAIGLFIIGLILIIGWIYEKIKNRNKVI